MAGFPEMTSLRHKTAPPLGRQAVVDHAKKLAADLRNVPRYVLRALLGIALVCGLLSLWGLRGDGTLPSMSPLLGLDPYRISSAACVAEGTPAEARWNGLLPALAILDRVNPAVAGWVREKHQNSRVEFRDQYDATAALAKYDRFRGRLVVGRELFCENDGTIAVTLCHEYRHSRQNSGKFCQYVLSFLFVPGGNLPIIENDAVVYEQEADNAIFGNGKSVEKEVAAWQAAERQNRDGKKGQALPISLSAVTRPNRLP